MAFPRAHDHRTGALSQARTAIATLNLDGGVAHSAMRGVRSASRGQDILLTYGNYGIWPLSD